MSSANSNVGQFYQSPMISANVSPFSSGMNAMHGIFIWFFKNRWIAIDFVLFCKILTIVASHLCQRILPELLALALQLLPAISPLVLKLVSFFTFFDIFV